MSPKALDLAAKGLRKAYRGRRVVDDVSLDISPGEIVGLLGPNGAGKTTTFYMMVGLVRPDGGQVGLGDREITDEPMYRRARMGVAYLAQEPSSFRKLSVEDNIWLILEALGVDAHDARRRIDGLLTDFGLAAMAGQRAETLSGGERRRLEVARALATDPTFILLDEPFAGIDPLAVADLQRIVKKLKDRGLGILITDHNVRDTLSITDRSYVMYEGSIKRSGSPDELAGDAEVREIYLGESFHL